MKFGFAVPSVSVVGQPCDYTLLRAVAKLGDESGAEALWVGDHLLWHLPIAEVVVALSTLGVLTERVRIGSNILLLPLRRPIDVAKAFASLSYLTDGRVILGVGVGGEYGDEWQAAGIDPRERGRRCDDAIEALGHYWNGSSWTGRYYDSPGVELLPRSSAPIPIWVGGRSDASLRRAAHCDGYMGIWLTAKRYASICAGPLHAERRSEAFRFGLQLFVRIDNREQAAHASLLSSLGENYGMDPEPFGRYLAAGSPSRIIELLHDYHSAGVDHVSVALMGADWQEQAERFVTDVAPYLPDNGGGS